MSKSVSKLQTLRRQRDIEKLFSKGQRFRGDYIRLVIRIRSGEGLRILLVADRHVGKAVVRNRFRRRMRHAMRELRSELQMGCDIAIVGLPLAADAAFADLVDELRTGLGRSNLLAPEND